LVYSEQQRLAKNRRRVAKANSDIAQGTNLEHWITKGNMAKAEAKVAHLEAKSMPYGTRLKS
jgi:hypothetical protein